MVVGSARSERGVVKPERDRILLTYRGRGQENRAKVESKVKCQQTSTGRLQVQAARASEGFITRLERIHADVHEGFKKMVIEGHGDR